MGFLGDEELAFLRELSECGDGGESAAVLEKGSLGEGRGGM
jgi:hypothetical protein